MTSAYPITLDQLTQQVKDLAVELGEIPSRNRVMRECRVGAEKAKAVLAALNDEGFTLTPVTPDPVEVEAASRHLHSVPATDAAESVPSAVPVEDVDPVVDKVEVVPVVDPVPSPVTESPDTGDESPAGGDGSDRGASVTRDETPPAGNRHESAESAESAAKVKRPRSWPLLLLAAGAFVAIWGGWVGLGELTGFGPIRLLPGIADSFVINSAITLPIGVEAYAAYALRVWLSGGTRSEKARRFARASAIGSLVLGAAGQVAYHLMVAAGITVAPWWITTFVSCLPVVVLGCGAALTHLLHDDGTEERR
ncbi:ABC transporter permease [Saccharothrix deserti]|uniref:ABC transporter permease n=1 Tax=Saccharothrix deserti TaxID=2593674 RepID=UPI00131AC7F3|nr:ABC transporter permease [Saccharothrix deserti]